MAGNRWRDHYSEKARQEKWLARSVYKLEEIDRKYHLVRKGQRVLDLGCYPGSWSQYCVKKVGNTGSVVGIDLFKPKGFITPNFRFLEVDILNIDLEWLVNEVGRVDLTLSDMAPKTSGVAISDTSRSMELAEKALEIALIVLKKKGHFLCKIFEGDGLKGFRKSTSEYFKQTRIIRPQAVRRKSREVYLLGQGLKI